MESANIPAVANIQERILITVNEPDKTDGLLDFAVMINTAQQKSPVYMLTVMQDEEGLKEKVALNNKNMESAIKHGAETETKVQVVTRVDLNMANGIARAVKEMLISDVVMEWSEKSSTTTGFLFNSLFGTTTQNVLDGVWETVFICRFDFPINTTKKMVLFLTRNAEYEIGFAHWVKRVIALSKQAGSRIVLCCTPGTQKACEKEIHKNRWSVELNFRRFENIEDFQGISGEISSSDLIIAVSARKGTVSHHSYMESVSARLIKNFPRNNLILLYPEQTQAEFLEAGMQPEDLVLTPIQEQIDNITRLSKAVKKIFKGKIKPVCN